MSGVTAGFWKTFRHRYGFFRSVICVVLHGPTIPRTVSYLNQLCINIAGSVAKISYMHLFSFKSRYRHNRFTTSRSHAVTNETWKIRGGLLWFASTPYSTTLSSLVFISRCRRKGLWRDLLANVILNSKQRTKSIIYDFRDGIFPFPMNTCGLTLLWTSIERRSWSKYIAWYLVIF